MFSQWGWRAFQIALMGGIGYWASHLDTPASKNPAAIWMLAMLVAALATGLLAALFRAIRFALGRSTVDDRIWRATKPPRSPLAAAHDAAELRRVANRHPR